MVGTPTLPLNSKKQIPEILQEKPVKYKHLIKVTILKHNWNKTCSETHAAKKTYHKKHPRAMAVSWDATRVLLRSCGVRGPKDWLNPSVTSACPVSPSYQVSLNEEHWQQLHAEQSAAESLTGVAAGQHCHPLVSWKSRLIIVPSVFMLKPSLMFVYLKNIYHLSLILNITCQRS